MHAACSDVVLASPGCLAIHLTSKGWILCGGSTMLACRSHDSGIIDIKAWVLAFLRLSQNDKTVETTIAGGLPGNVSQVAPSALRGLHGLTRAVPQGLQCGGICVLRRKRTVRQGLAKIPQRLGRSSRRLDIVTKPLRPPILPKDSGHDANADNDDANRHASFAKGTRLG